MKDRIVCKCPTCPDGAIHLIRRGAMKYDFKCDNPKCQTRRIIIDRPDREKMTDIIYNALKEIEIEESIRLSDRAFIADHLAPKVKQYYEQECKECSAMDWAYKHPYFSNNIEVIK